MARSKSDYTASPTRYRSPQRSPARRPATEDGSQYELDLDVLGLNSTFESTGLEESHAPKVDRVDTSDIEGPEDFTMNMTYWMTADLPLARAQIRSRKEAKATVEEVEEDVQSELDGPRDATEEGDKAVVEDSRETEEHHDFDSRSPTMRANGTVDGDQDGEVLFESSMENDEKVMSYLSALPDTDADLPDAIASTPLHIKKQDRLHVPNSAIPRTRSLQATVEDYADTPRKPTQDTIIHHGEESILRMNTQGSRIQEQADGLREQLERQELASKTRILELESVLASTRSELESAQMENQKQQGRITSLEQAQERQSVEQGSEKGLLHSRLKQQEQEFSTKMQEFGEELRLQNLAKLQNQRDDFERQMQAVEEAKKTSEEQLEKKDLMMQQLRSDFELLRRSKQGDLETVESIHSANQQQKEKDFMAERAELESKLSSLQTRADTLEADLARATAEAKSARETAQANAAIHSTSQISNQANTNQIANLESRLRSVQSQLASSQADVASKDQQILQDIEEQDRMDQCINTAQGRIEGLESTLSALRKQLAEAQRESSKAKTDMENLERELEDANDRLSEARAEADLRVADVDKKLIKMRELKTEAEARFKKLQTEQNGLIEEKDAKIEEVHDKAEDGIRKIGALLEQERTEKKRLAKELKKSMAELEQVRTEAVAKAAEQDVSPKEDETSHSDSKDVEIENLRKLVRKQASSMKDLKTQISSLRKDESSSKAQESELDSLRTKLQTSQSELGALRLENSTLRTEAETRREDFEAINQQLDERLAMSLKSMLRERTKKAVGKRDDQWVESMEKLQGEKELMGRVLMREWGRQECGVAAEGEKQAYRYKYVKR